MKISAPEIRKMPPLPVVGTWSVFRTGVVPSLPVHVSAAAGALLGDDGTVSAKGTQCGYSTPPGRAG